jgi:hypothetical protein
MNLADAGNRDRRADLAVPARARARAHVVGTSRFVEVFVSTPLAVCEARDPKGLYRRACAGELAGFTGVDAPYEPPSSPAKVVDTGGRSPAQCADELMHALLPMVARARSLRASGSLAPVSAFSTTSLLHDTTAIELLLCEAVGARACTYRCRYGRVRMGRPR